MREENSIMREREREREREERREEEKGRKISSPHARARR